MIVVGRWQTPFGDGLLEHALLNVVQSWADPSPSSVAESWVA